MKYAGKLWQAKAKVKVTAGKTTAQAKIRLGARWYAYKVFYTRFFKISNGVHMARPGWQ